MSSCDAYADDDMLKTQTTAEALYKKLKNIKVGGTVCHYSFKKCEEMVRLQRPQ